MMKKLVDMGWNTPLSPWLGRKFKFDSTYTNNQWISAVSTALVCCSKLKLLNLQNELRSIEENYVRRYWELWEQNKKLKNVLSVSDAMIEYMS